MTLGSLRILRGTQRSSADRLALVRVAQRSRSVTVGAGVRVRGAERHASGDSAAAVERRGERRIELSVGRVGLGVAAAAGPGAHRGDADEGLAGGFDRREPAGPDGGQQAGAVGGALGRGDGGDLGAEDVGEDLPPDGGGGAAAGGADLGRVGRCRRRSSGRGRRAGRRPRPPGRPGSGAAGRGPRSGRRTRRGPAGPGAASAPRSGRAGRTGRPAAASTSPAAAASAPKSSPGASASRNHRNDPAAESMTVIRCQRPGTAWQNAWTCPRGSRMSAESVVANTTPDVPRDRATTPGTTAPTPTPLADWSPPPATTGVPARSPVASAAAARHDARDLRPLERRRHPRRR